MRTILILLGIASIFFAAELPRTLGGVAPGENVDAYVGILGYPSTQVTMGSVQIWSWGEGLLVKIDVNKTVTEVMITRPGKQRELRFDIGEPLAEVTKKLGKNESSSEQLKAGIYKYSDTTSGLVLSLSIDESKNLEKISLAKGNQTR